MVRDVLWIVSVTAAVAVGFVIVASLERRTPPQPAGLPVEVKRVQIYMLDDLRTCQEASPVICSCRPAGIVSKAPAPKPTTAKSPVLEEE